MLTSSRIWDFIHNKRRNEMRRRFGMLHDVIMCAAAFALATLFGDPIERASPLWIVAFALFFYSGRRTWQALQTGFPSPIYFVFKRGNSAMLGMSVILTLIATALQSNPLFAFVAMHLLPNYKTLSTCLPRTSLLFLVSFTHTFPLVLLELHCVYYSSSSMHDTRTQYVGFQW